MSSTCVLEIATVEIILITIINDNKDNDNKSFGKFEGGVWCNMPEKARIKHAHKL